MTINPDALKQVLPENQAAMASASTSGDAMINVSTVNVEETPAFNTGDYQIATQARAGTAEHLNFAAVGLAREPVAQMKSELANIASQLKGIRLPDTRVNINNQKIEIPHDIKQYANDLDQGTYARILHALLETDRMNRIKMHSTKANQVTRPALWLNQLLVVETKQPYVYTLRRDVEAELKKEGLMDVNAEAAEQASALLRQALGGQLWQALSQIANVNQLSIYAIFVLLVDRILASHETTSQPFTAQSIWEGVTTPVENPRKDITAASVLGVNA